MVNCNGKGLYFIFKFRIVNDISLQYILHSLTVLFYSDIPHIIMYITSHAIDRFSAENVGWLTVFSLLMMMIVRRP